MVEKVKGLRQCWVCGSNFRAKRIDAELCGSTCRSRAHRVDLGKLTVAQAKKLGREHRELQAKLKKRRKR